MEYYKRLLKENKASVFFLICFSFGIDIGKLTAKLINAAIVDYLIAGDYDNTILCLSLILIVGIMSVCSSFFVNLKKTTLESNMRHNLENRFIQKILKTQHSSLSRFNSIYLAQRLHGDINSVVGFFCGNVDCFVKNILLVLVILSILWSIHPFYFLIAILSIPPYIILLLKYMKKTYYSAYVLKEARNVYGANATEQISNSYTIKCNNLYDKVQSGFQMKYERMFQTIKAHFNNLFMFRSFDSIIAIVVNVLFIISGVYLFSKQRITIGVFNVTLSLYNMLLAGIRYYIDLRVRYSECKAAIVRLDEIERFPQDDGGDWEPLLIEKVNVMNLYYQYDDGAYIHYPNLMIKTGEIVAIKGANGSGKTTLINLLLGILQSPEGTIFYNDMDILRVGKVALREHITYVAQSPLAWDLTIGEFITMHLGKTIDKMDDLLFGLPTELKLIYESIQLSSNSFEVLDIRMSNLSLGQQKKLMLVTFLAKKHDLLIMDEPEAYLDKGSVDLLVKLLHKQKSNKITIVISHNDCIVSAVDKEVHIT